MESGPTTRSLPATTRAAGADTFQILALDGGGIKGLFSAAVLAHLEEDLGISVADHFDLLAGTSTGGIIALALAAGFRPREIVQFYVANAGRIFPPKLFKSFSLRKLTHLFLRKYPSAPLQEALREQFGDRLLRDCSKRVVIPSYNLDNDDVYVFKTRHHPRLRRDYREPIWKVAMATSAAPTYFPAFHEVDHIRLVDGGVWANNPAVVGIAEAVSMLEVPLESIRVFSLGTTEDVAKRSNRLTRGGQWQWRKAAVSVVMRGQSVGANAQALHLLGRERLLRFNPSVPDKLFALDRLTEKELMGRAASTSRELAPDFKTRFCGHFAPQFEPIPASSEKGATS